MDKETNINVNHGGWFSGLLFLIFLTLKLCGVITWSWWWVTAPLWIPFALVLIILFGLILGALLSEAWKRS